MKDWINFNKSEKLFSHAFRNQCKQQLMTQFDNMIGTQGIINKFEYFIDVSFNYSQMDEGTLEEEVNIHEKNGYMFMNVKLNSPSSYCFNLRIAWTCSNKIDLTEIHKKEELPSDLMIVFCNDFPTDHIKSEIKPHSTFVKGEEGLAFPIEFYVLTFPDVSIEFDTSLDVKSDVKEINHLFNHFSDQKFEHFGVRDYNGTISIGLDYFITQEKDEIQLRMNELLTLFKKLSELEIAKQINGITVM